MNRDTRKLTTTSAIRSQKWRKKLCAPELSSRLHKSLQQLGLADHDIKYLTSPADSSRWNTLIILALSYAMQDENDQLVPLLHVIRTLCECPSMKDDTDFTKRCLGIVSFFEQCCSVSSIEQHCSRNHTVSPSFIEPTADLIPLVEEHLAERRASVAAATKDRKANDQTTALRMWVACAIGAKAVCMVTGEDFRLFFKRSSSKFLSKDVRQTNVVNRLSEHLANPTRRTPSFDPNMIPMVQPAIEEVPPPTMIPALVQANHPQPPVIPDCRTLGFDPDPLTHPPASNPSPVQGSISSASTGHESKASATPSAVSDLLDLTASAWGQWTEDWT
ncbi:hypothetical protein J8273_3306 [Carpediemonas membranifera]|uniref:Uncharacterized protein n=1 Tax=Carpediemonas membranifera TaxID=201153 RepID=A0A8J6BA76_9EUKA|nr:hypothetical protein J8273_3306 [Carpediemonas membranifera]|eukprot:KAG9393177.1 hypothetical protein J8273_3306 [Carpediemonas membranifera]